MTNEDAEKVAEELVRKYVAMTFRLLKDDGSISELTKEGATDDMTKALLTAASTARAEAIDEAEKVIAASKAFEETHNADYYGFCHQLDRAIDAIRALKR